MAPLAFLGILLITSVFNSWCTGYIYRTNFTFLINQPDFCSRHSRTPYIIVCVPTSTDHFERRDAFRQSLGSKFVYDQLNIITAFFVGIPQNRIILKRLINESRTYGDLIMANHIDSHENLTFKNLAIMRFVHDHCQNVTYVIKTDDDTFIDMFEAVRILRTAERINKLTTEYNVLESGRAAPTTLTKTFFGRAFDKNQPQRFKCSKYYVSRKAFPSKFYPGK